MVGFRITGIVRAARDAREYLRQGVPLDDRRAFLDDVSRSVDCILDLCVANHTPAERLPAPSRRALADLRAIAAMDEDDVPTSDADADAALVPKISISHIVSALERVLTRLETGAPDYVGVERALSEARSRVTRVDKICQQNDTTPAGLPRPTGEAYAMLRWLLDDGHVDRYIAQRDAAAEHLAAAFRRQGTLPTPSDDDATKQVSVRFQPGQRVYSIRRSRSGTIIAKLSVGWLAAGNEEMADLAEIVVARKATRPAVVARQRAFVDSEDYGAMHHELTALRECAVESSKGRVYDLEALFLDLNQRFFDGALPRPRLDWHTSASHLRFGFYVASLDRVCIDDRLDHPDVPPFVAEFVLYHELLHKRHGTEMRGRRGHSHTSAFKADERRHPRCAEAERWLDALAAGLTAPAPPRVPAPPVHPSAPVVERAPLPTRPPPWLRSPPAPGGGPRPAKVPRNAPCPCGSGRKSKRCCGRA